MGKIEIAEVNTNIYSQFIFKRLENALEKNLYLQ